MELWDIYDINRQKTGEIMERGAEFKEDAYTCVMHVCIFNSEGKMLIQQRQPFKTTWPVLWDLSIGGHIEAGETSEDSAERELFEELGIKRDFSNERPHFTINFVHGFDDYFFLLEDIDLDELTLQETEVKAVKWAGLEEIKKMIEDGSFIPYFPSLIDFMFESKNGRGAHVNEPDRFVK